MNESDQASSVAPAAKRLVASKTEQAEWVRRFVESGLSLRKFSAQHALPRMSLWRWVSRARPEGAAVAPAALAGFTEIKFPPALEGSAWVAELKLPNGTVLRLAQEVPAALLEQLLRLC
jgi:hypothetical protein